LGTHFVDLRWVKDVKISEDCDTESYSRIFSAIQLSVGNYPL
jgi:hypothetical protein